MTESPRTPSRRAAARRVVPRRPAFRRIATPALAAAVVAALAVTAPAAAQSPSSEAPEAAVGSAVGLSADAPLHTTLVYPPFAHTLGIHRARPEHLALFLGDRTAFDDPQGLAAVKFASDDDPGQRGDDFQLTLFGVNAGRHEILYNSSMQTLAIYGGPGAGEGRFRSPRGIAATVDGRVYVADAGNERVARLRWNPAGRSLAWAGSWPAPEPFDVATDARGQAWVSDRAADAVLRFADSTAGAGTALLPPNPVPRDRWPLPDDVADPLGLAIGDGLDPWYRPDGYRLYLVDRDGARLRAYDVEGRILAEVSAADLERSGGGPGRFFYVALDYFGNVWATDPVGGVVYKLDPDLRPLAVFPGTGETGAALEEPRGIAVWRRFGQVFVAEREGARYFFVGADFGADSPVVVRGGETGPWSLDLRLTEASTVSVAFLDAAGDTLGAASAGVVGTGATVVRWSRGAWERPPEAGWRERAERIAIEARPTYSSRKRFSRVRVLPVAWAAGGELDEEPAATRQRGPRPGPDAGSDGPESGSP